MKTIVSDSGSAFLSAIFICGLLTFPLSAQVATSLKVAAATNKRVDLTWSGTAATYVVQRRTLGGTFSSIATVSTASASDTQIDAYTTYQYQVLANTNDGQSAPSNTVTAGPPAAGFTALPGPGGVTATSTYGRNISMTLDGNGDPALIYIYDDPNGDTNYSDSELVFRSWNRAQYAWNPDIKIDAVGDTSSAFRTVDSLAFDPSTNTFAAAVSINDGDSINVYTSSNGNTWTKKASYSESDGVLGPSVGLSGGNIYLAYVGENGLQYVTGKLSADPATWQNKTAPQPTDTDIAAWYVSPSLAVDSAGNPAIAYFAEQTSNTDNLILFFWRPSANPVKVLDSQNNGSDGAAVKLTFLNQNPNIVAAVSRNDIDEEDQVHFVRSTDGGVTWQTPVAIPPDGHFSTGYAFDLAVNSQGHGAIAFSQNSGSGDDVCGYPKLSQSSDLVKWTTCAAAERDVTGAFSPIPDSIQLAYGGNDKLYMVWQDTYIEPNGIQMYREPPAGTVTGPSISANGVVNNATNQAGIVGGSWVSIYGANFSTTTRTWAAADFTDSVHLPTMLDGVQVNINGTPASVFFISQTQINVQAPSQISGNVSVQVIHNGVASNTVTASAVANAPGLFTYAAGGKTFPAAVFNDTSNGLVIVGDASLLAGTAKAHPGDIILLYATGLENSPAGTIINAPIADSAPIQVTIGSAKVTPSFSGLVAAGEFQLNVTVPNLPPGDYPISITANGVTSPAGPVISITQ
ncbi:MAG TPA: IPT/TIG domain-containing protein [Bryobacteraceae bacterium]|nr:IPT/TIG domain-containing protein [Bryobacteraceae bacterium]